MKAFEDQVQKLPESIQNELKEVYMEYEERESLESMIVKDADTLELAFQSLEYLQIGYSAHLNRLEELETRLYFDESKEILKSFLIAI